MAFSRKSLVATLTAGALFLTACSGEETTETATTTAEVTTTEATTVETTADAASADGTVTLEDNYGTKTVPVDPETVVSLDNRTFEVLAEWGVELAAAPLNLMPDTITAYTEDGGTVNIGNHREPDLEAITAASPDLIVSGQRFTQHDEDIEALNPDTPIINFEPRDDEPFADELIRQVEAMGQVFDKEDEAAQLIADFEEAIERAREAYDGQSTVMAVNVSGGEIGYIAPSVGRTFGPIFDLLGLEPALVVEGGTSDHQGDDISVEAIAESNPDIILIMDRDGAVGDEGATPGEQVVRDNPALQNTTALTNDAIYVAPADTYINESIITFTEILNGMADLFEAQS